MGKDLENRGRSVAKWWRGLYERGHREVLLHASLWWDEQEVFDQFQDAKEMARRAGFDIGKAPKVTLRDLKEQRGGIVGIMRLGEPVDRSDSPWFVGPWGLPIQRVQALPRIPWKGALGFFGCPPELEAAVRGILNGACACESDLENPGPTHLASCPFSDPNYIEPESEVRMDTDDLKDGLREIEGSPDVVVAQRVDGEIRYLDIADARVQSLPDGRTALVLDPGEVESGTATDAGAG